MSPLRSKREGFFPHIAAEYRAFARACRNRNGDLSLASYLRNPSHSKRSVTQ